MSNFSSHELMKKPH